MDGWLLLAGLLEQGTDEVVSRMRGTQTVSHSVYFLVLTCFPHDLADVSEQQSYSSLF